MKTKTKNSIGSIVGLLVMMFVSTADAAVRTWDGLGTSANWRQVANWGGTSWPVTGDDVVFAGTNRPAPSNNNTEIQLPSLGSITFASTASSFSLLGAYAIGLTGSVVNNSTNTQTFNTMGLKLMTNNTFNTAAGNITINASIIGSGGLTKSGAYTLTLTNQNTYTGATVVQAGTLSISKASLAVSNDVRITSGAILNLNFSGTNTISGFYIDGVQQAGGTWGAPGSGAEHESSLLAGVGLIQVGAPELSPASGFLFQLTRFDNGRASEAAFGFESIKLGGVMGHRIDTMINGNILQLDMDGTFLSPFLNLRKRTSYIGLGKTLEAIVHFAALTGDSRLVELKNQIIDKLINSQDPDGYIGTFPAGSDRWVGKYDTHEKSTLILPLVSDYLFFGREKSLDAARKLANEMIVNWPVSFEKVGIWTLEYPFIRLSVATGDPKYEDWVKATFDPSGVLSPVWTQALGGDPTQALDLWNHHVYRWCDVNISMLDLNRNHPNPVYQKAWPQMLAWLKDGGSLPTGSFALGEDWQRSQETRQQLYFEPAARTISVQPKVCESCAKFYIMQLLNRLERIAPDPYYGDVMERAYLNGIFAAQWPSGRQLAYGLNVEGTRFPWGRDTYCCPGNLRRAFSYLPGYVYNRKDDKIYVNLYGESDARIKLPDGATMRLMQNTDYPASGNIQFKVETSAPIEQEIIFRIPLWCETPEVTLNGEIQTGVKSGTFFSVRRAWKTGDRVGLNFPMKWRWLRGIRMHEGRAALARGPIIYSLNPAASGITEYKELPFPEKGTTVRPMEVPGYADHVSGYAFLESITIDPLTLSEPETTADPAFGSKVTAKGWIGAPQGEPNRTFVFNDFANIEGRKIYLKLADETVAANDELFAAALHEDMVYPARWAALKEGLDQTKLATLPDAGLNGAALVTPGVGSFNHETSRGEIAGHRVWMSAALVTTGTRRMLFDVTDARFAEGACPGVTISVMYLDKGDCTVTLTYDAWGDDPTNPKGARRTAGAFQVGNSGEWKIQRYTLPDARFAQLGSDFELRINRDVDFVIQGAYLPPAGQF